MAQRTPLSSFGSDLRRHKPDYSLILISGLLLLFGLIIIYSVSPALAIQSGDGSSESYFIYRQLVHVGLGVSAFAVAALIPLHWWRALQPLLIVSAIVATLLILIPGIGETVNGATRWIQLGPVTFQPAELTKFTILLYAAAFLTERARRNTLHDRRETLMPLLVIIAVVGFFVAVAQKDLGTMISVIAIVLAMMYVSGLRLRDLALVGGLLSLASGMAVILFPHRLDRITAFFDNSIDTEATSYHINQALIAIGTGGIAGQGLGRSIQVYGYLPEADTDSIFAIIAEKFGFIGTVLILFLYAALFIRLLRIMQRSENFYFKLVASGVFAWIFAHTIINIAAMLGLMPITGITLPLLSLGGTSLLFIMAALGLVFNISRYTRLGDNAKKKGFNANSSRRRRNGRSRYADSPRSSSS